MRTVMHIAQAPGGVERYLQMLLKYFDKKEFRHILVLSQDYDFEKFKGLADSIECVGMYRSINLMNELKAAWKVRKLIKKYKPDIVYMHSTKAGVIGRIANFGIKNVSVYNPHGWAFNMKCGEKKQRIYAAIERLFAPLCTQIVAISDYEKESAAKRHICNAAKIQVIYNGIDFKEYPEDRVYPTREELCIPKKAFVVGTVGRLDKQKAPDVFVKSAEIIKKEIPNAFFVMVGNGSQETEILQMIAEKGLKDSFLITGWKKNPYDYINEFDIAMLLSRWEGFGLALPEYMFFGKPIVATKVDAIPNIIEDEVNGLLVEMDDYISAAERVIEIYSNTKLKEKLILNGKEQAKKRFDAKRVSEEHENLFRRLI